MRKSIALLIALVFGANSWGQQIEFGVFGGYAFHNIVNTKINDGRAVIGDPIWDVNKGALVTYYFKEDSGVKLTAQYANINKGSKSEKYSDAKFEYQSNMLGLLVGYSNDIADKLNVYADIGLGYSQLETSHGYKGKNSQTDAFPKLEADLEMKSSEINFLFDLGLEYVLTKEFKLFCEMYTDPAFIRFNSSQGKYQNQGIGFNVGLRYAINLKKETVEAFN